MWFHFDITSCSFKSTLPTIGKIPLALTGMWLTGLILMEMPLKKPKKRSFSVFFVQKHRLGHNSDFNGLKLFLPRISEPVDILKYN
jgi:hypothetical protein